MKLRVPIKSYFLILKFSINFFFDFGFDSLIKIVVVNIITFNNEFISQLIRVII